VSEERLFGLLICLAGGVIAFVIIVGGVVCLADQGYTFAEYLSDLTNVWPYLIGAIAAVLLRSLVRQRNGNGKAASPPHDR
jgi:TRAP-type C4-dicarboxylate transport system permease small subunit